MAGESVEEAIVAARRLGANGIGSMLDHLGENVSSSEQASAAADQYVLALKRLREADDVDGAISVKLTQLGLDLSYDLCLEHARKHYRLDENRVVARGFSMGGASCWQYAVHYPTVWAAAAPGAGFAETPEFLNVFQAEKVVSGLPEASRIRLVKGAYLEPETVAFPDRAEVDRSFARLFATLVARGHSVHVATHDPRLVEGARLFVERRGVPWRRIEFQMLYGIRRDLQQRLARDHYPVRVYIPYGTEWYPYLTRRLAERPANLWFFAQNLVRMGR